MTSQTAFEYRTIEQIADELEKSITAGEVHQGTHLLGASIYNALVSAYNQGVGRYNTQIAPLRSRISNLETHLSHMLVQFDAVCESENISVTDMEPGDQCVIREARAAVNDAI